MTTRDKFLPVIATFLVLDFIVVGLRLGVRFHRKSVGYDDLAMLVSFIGYIILSTMELAAIHYGLGATTMEPQFDAMKAAMYFTIAQVVYILATGVSKLGVGLVLLRLTNATMMTGLRSTLIILMVTYSVASLSVTIVFGLQCRPLSVAWGVGEGSCMQTSVLGNTAIGLSTVDVIASWMYALVLPVWMLYKANISFKLKITITSLLGLGATASILTIIRLKYVIELSAMTSNSGLASPEVLEQTMEGTLYSIGEIGLSIFTAALTALRPLLAKIAFFASTKDSNPSDAHFANVRRSNSNFLAFGGQAAAYRLDDLSETHAAESQENIIPSPRTMQIQKDTQYEVRYDTRSSQG